MNDIALEDVYYFSVKARQCPDLLAMVGGVIEVSQADAGDRAEIQRRLRILTASTEAEHIRQCSNFVAEAHAFSDLVSRGHEPHWVAESNIPTPDIRYTMDDRQVAVEVKHLNSPRDEHEALYSGATWSGSVNSQYDAGLAKKIAEHVASARRKFAAFNAAAQGESGETGILYLYFSKSIDAHITDGIEWIMPMHDRVTAMAERLTGDDIQLFVFDIDSI